MKTTICVVAKNEDNYIDEWLDYHFKIGFTDIFVYQNDWRYKGDFINDKRLHLKDADGLIDKKDIWNDFIQKYYNEYNWVAFIDVDEFIGIKTHQSIDQFLSNYSDKIAIQIHWRWFGDNGYTKIINNNYSCIDRFLKSDKNISDKIKTIVNLSISKQNIKMVNHWSEPKPFDISPDLAEIAHYQVKTKQEWIERKYKNLDGINISQNEIFKDFKNVINWFNARNRNDIKNTLIYDIYHNIN